MPNLPTPGFVLVVEDDPILRCLVTLILEDEGLTVLSTGTAHEAIDVVLQQRPDLVLLDIAPRGDSESVGRAVRAQYGKQVSIIIMSALARSIGEQAAARLGALACIAKPFDVGDVIVTVRRGLQYSCHDADLQPGIGGV